MKHLKDAIPNNGTDCPVDVEDSAAALQTQLIALDEQLQSTQENSPFVVAKIHLDRSRALIGLDRQAEGWQAARAALDVFLQQEQWEFAADACDALFAAEQDSSLSALGQGVWLGVTFPIDPELSIGLLQHIVDETPDDYDGAAVAAATALYLVDLRCEGKQHDNLAFFANQMLGSVARRHSDVNSQAEFDLWMERLELHDPQKFLPRLRNVVDVLVQDDWWFDRDELQAKIPVN